MESLGINYRLGISTSLLYAGGAPRPLDGLGVYTAALIREYRQMGINPEGYVFPPAPASDAYGVLPKTFRAMLLQGFLPFAPPLSMLTDVYHVTDYRSVRMSCPVVTTLYDAIPFVAPEMTNTRLRYFKNLLLKRSANFADHVIAISHYATTELVEHYDIPEAKISVVYCGVDEEWLLPPDASTVQQTLKARGLESEYFLTVGTIQPRKNLERLMAAHDRLSDQQRRAHPLVVVGREGWNCEAIIQKIYSKISLGEAVWLNDVSDREELKCLYFGAKAFLYPSLYEGFGLPILEAFATGTPVLTSNTTCLPEISHGIGFEVDPCQVDKICEVMLYLIEPGNHADRIAAGRKRAADLSWRRCAEETLSVYSQVLSGRS